RISTIAERQAESKRKFEDTPRNNQNGDKKSYEGTKPLCPKCKFNHYGPCIPTCTNYKKLGHLAPRTVGAGLQLQITTTTTAITITTTTATIITTTTVTTTQEPKGQIPMPSFALSVGLQATSRRTAPSGRTRTREMVML
ncbi:hypothetical protein Tco_0305804, partial [Tanacetum coccineum]